MIEVRGPTKRFGDLVAVDPGTPTPGTVDCDDTGHPRRLGGRRAVLPEAEGCDDTPGSGELPDAPRTFTRHLS